MLSVFLDYTKLQLECKNWKSRSGKPKCTETPCVSSFGVASEKTDLIAIFKSTPAVGVCLLEEGAVVTDGEDLQPRQCDKHP